MTLINFRTYIIKSVSGPKFWNFKEELRIIRCIFRRCLEKYCSKKCTFSSLNSTSNLNEKNQFLRKLLQVI